MLTRAAEADLRAILRYSRREWGADQARRYAAKLDRALMDLAGDGLAFGL